MGIEFGLDTFGDITSDEDGVLLRGAQTIRNIVAQARLADRVGVDFFGVGEHHRADVLPKTEKGLACLGRRRREPRVARHGLGLMLAIIGGPAARFCPFVDLYHRFVAAFRDTAFPVAVHSPGHTAETDAEAWEAAYSGVQAMNDTIARKRG